MSLVNKQETHPSSAASSKSQFYLPKTEGKKCHLIPEHTGLWNGKTPVPRPLCQTDHIPPYSHLPWMGTRPENYLTCPHPRDWFLLALSASPARPHSLAWERGCVSSRLPAPVHYLSCRLLIIALHFNLMLPRGPNHSNRLKVVPSGILWEPPLELSCGSISRVRHSPPPGLLSGDGTAPSPLKPYVTFLPYRVNIPALQMGATAFLQGMSKWPSAFSV